MIVISLCDLTGHFVHPWVEAGHRAILVDPQHGEDHYDGPILKLAKTVEEAAPMIGDAIRSGDVAFVAGFPPCTDMAVSGARWFESKRAVDPMFQAKAVAVAEQCRTIGKLSGAPYFVENPVSVLSRAFGPADHWFHPWHYAGLEPADNYTKRTQLWTGNGFVMPPASVDAWLGEPDDRIHKAAPGPARARELPQRHADGLLACGVRCQRACRPGGGLMTTRAYCYTQDAGRPHGMQDIEEIDDRAPAMTSTGPRLFTWTRFACGCVRAIEKPESEQ